MSDVTVPQLTRDAIYNFYKNKKDEPRRYLGASSIGENCTRKLWYQYRNALAEDHDGRTMRLFDTGKREELRIIEDLRNAGLTVLDIDPETKKQWRFNEFGGKLSGGLDAVCLGVLEAPKTWHLLEVKTHNKKSFDDLEKKGVEQSKPTHYAQMIMYMGMAQLTRAIYVAVCKDDDRIYTERIRENPTQYKALLLKAKRIIESENVPEKVESFECKWCRFKEICDGLKIPDVNCRTCAHFFECNKEDACNDHLFLPYLLPWATPVDGTPEWILYRYKEIGFINCGATGFPAKDSPHYSSVELQKMTPDMIINPVIAEVKKVLGGTVV